MFILTRNGEFKITEHTDNQCKAKGHSAGYKYEIKVVVDQLDAQGFAIDHNEINDVIANQPIKGSCEELCELIFNRVKKLKFAGTLLAYKSTIKPITAKKEAFIEFRWYNPSYKQSKFWLSNI
jgi:6-pyruvoyl-tetrahydropterin synthase